MLWWVREVGYPQELLADRFNTSRADCVSFCVLFLSLDLHSFVFTFSLIFILVVIFRSVLSERVESSESSRKKICQNEPSSKPFKPSSPSCQRRIDELKYITPP